MLSPNRGGGGANELRAAVLSVTVIFVVCSCAGVSTRESPKVPVTTSSEVFNAEPTIQDYWQHMVLQGKTEYRSVSIDGIFAISAVGRASASGLVRRIAIDVNKCPNVEWVWRVDKLQLDADIRTKRKEDVAASVFFLFGDPGFLFDPQPVPTLRYVWTNGSVPLDAIIDSPYLPGVVRSIVVQSGTDNLGLWTTEHRNLNADFERAFGRPPDSPVEAVVLFTDNDQTRQPVEAYYARARVWCDGQ